VNSRGVKQQARLTRHSPGKKPLLNKGVWPTSRRREAAKRGYGVSDEKPAMEVELGELPRPYVQAIDHGLAA
jgi:hypothetical protein